MPKKSLRTSWSIRPATSVVGGSRWRLRLTVTGAICIVDNLWRLCAPCGARSRQRLRPRSPLSAMPARYLAIMSWRRHRRPLQHHPDRLRHRVAARFAGWSIPTHTRSEKSLKCAAAIFRLTPTNIRRTRKLFRPIYAAHRRIRLSAGRRTRNGRLLLGEYRPGEGDSGAPVGLGLAWFFAISV